MINSICFSSALVDALNDKARTIDPRLYLFAYYEPKTLKEDDSPRAQFFFAIINLYALLWDCGPFVQKDLMNCSKSNPLENILPDVIWDKKKDIVFRCKNFANIVSHFRSIICHNSSEMLALNNEHFRIVSDWLSHKCHIYKSYDELSQDNWKKMMCQLVSEANKYVDDVNHCLDTLINCRGTQRFGDACEYWLKAIARNYLTNPDLLLNAMTGLYEMHLLGTKMSRNPHVSLRNLTIQWLVDIFTADRRYWYKIWLDDVSELETSKVYQLLKDWQSEWESRNPHLKGEPCEVPLPASIFFLVLADDVYKYAQSPNIHTAYT